MKKILVILANLTNPESAWLTFNRAESKNIANFKYIYGRLIASKHQKSGIISLSLHLILCINSKYFMYRSPQAKTRSFVKSQGQKVLHFYCKKLENIITCGAFKNYICCVGGRRSLKSEGKWMGGGGSSVFVCLLHEKKCLIFHNKTEFFLISCLVVAKSFLDVLLKRKTIFFHLVFLIICKYFYCHCVLKLCKKHWSFISFLSFHSLIFHSSIHDKNVT